MIIPIKDSFPAAVVMGLSLVAGPVAAGGMMGGGMMGGMMGQGANSSPSQSEESSNPAARNLLEYVRSNGLSCLSCHSVSARSVGPAFTDIAKRHAGNDGAQSALEESITTGATGKRTGYPAMPGGLASSSQAKKLAALIVSVTPQSDH